MRSMALVKNAVVGSECSSQWLWSAKLPRTGNLQGASSYCHIRGIKYNILFLKVKGGRLQTQMTIGMSQVI